MSDNDIVELVLRTSRREVAEGTRQKVTSYLRLLASTGQTKRQLKRYGVAYLREILEPDSRYTGL